jgi:hypothetical protein
MGESRVHTGFWRGNPRERDHLEDPGVDGWSKLKWIISGEGGMDWIDLVRGRDRRRALVNAVMNFQLPQNAGNF